MGLIEPHACYLNLPESNVLLYKVITLDNFIRSILGGYLYFNRVDSYRDFKNADLHDGSQLPLDRIINEKELRISLSALGIGQFILGNGEAIDFLPNLFMTFDFITAIKNKTIIKILAKKHEELNCAEFIENFSILS